MSLNNWYYLEEPDESKKEGPFSLDEILDFVNQEIVDFNCLISNDTTPWIFLSEYLKNEQANDETVHPFIDRKFESPQTQKKDIQIVIDSTLSAETTEEQKLDKLNDEMNAQKVACLKRKQQIERDKNEKMQIEKEQKLRKEHEEKLKNEVLKLKSTKEFDEQWFVWIDSVKIGPLNRWQLVKKAKNGQINGENETYLDGKYRFLRDCGELRGLVPFEISLNAQTQTNEVNDNVILTKHAMENKLYFFKDAYQQSIGPLSLSEIFYKFSEGLIGRNTQIKTEKEKCWKTMEFVQNKFSKEWKKWNENENDDESDKILEKSDEECDTLEIESFDPSFRALIDLDKQYKNNHLRTDEIKQKKQKKKKKSKKRKRDKMSSTIFVSGLPLDISLNELSKFFKKAGVIQTDIYQNGKEKIILNDDGSALITFYQPYSVKLALDILDETEIKNGFPVHIKATNDPKPARKKQKIDRKKEAMLQRLYGVKNELKWNEESKHKGLHWVVFENVFDLKQVSVNDAFIKELENEMVGECSKIGKIEKIQIFDENPKGIIKIKFKNAKDCEICIDKMNERCFDGRIIKCFYWDGFTDYSVFESIEQQRMRLKQFRNDLKGIKK